MEKQVEIEESKGKNKGFTLIELLIVIVILGILAAVTVFAVRGITDKGKSSACGSDKVTLQTAVESYFAQYGNVTGIPTTGAGTIPTTTTAIPSAENNAITAPTGVTAGPTAADTLVSAGFLRATPTKFFVGETGKTYVLDVACGGSGTVAI